MIIYELEKDTYIADRSQTKEFLVTFEGGILVTQCRTENSEINELMLMDTEKRAEELLGQPTNILEYQVLRIQFKNKEEVDKLLFEVARLYEIMRQDEEERDERERSN